MLKGRHCELKDFLNVQILGQFSSLIYKPSNGNKYMALFLQEDIVGIQSVSIYVGNCNFKDHFLNNASNF